MREEQAEYNTNTDTQELYRRLSVPFATEAARDMAIEDFWGIVQSARIQCALSDVHLAVRTNHIDDKGVEQNAITSGHMERSDAALSMPGYGYADTLAVHRKFLESLDEGGIMPTPRDVQPARGFADRLLAIKEKRGCDHEAANSDMGDVVCELLTNLGYGEGVEVLGSEWHG